MSIQTWVSEAYVVGSMTIMARLTGEPDMYAGSDENSRAGFRIPQNKAVFSPPVRRHPGNVGLHPGAWVDGPSGGCRMSSFRTCFRRSPVVKVKFGQALFCSDDPTCLLKGVRIHERSQS